MTVAPPPRRVTSFDVAERAGVNQSTVSRALKGDPSITEQTRIKVEDAARELGYFVDDRAARLRSGKTETVAIVVIAREGLDATEINPFHYNLLGSTCAAASARGYQALVSIQSAPEHFYSDYIESRQADCVIVLGTATNDAAWEFHRPLLSRDHVASWGSPFDEHARTSSDNVAGGRMAVEALLSAGYRDIAFIGDTGDRQYQFRERYEGYRQAMAEAGLSATEPVFAEAEMRVEQGRRAARALLQSGVPCDALFCCCDAMALGALEALNEAGVDVPEAIGIIGFDGLGVGAHSNPPLTTIEPDFKQAGIALVEAALGERSSEAELRVPVRLVERSSVRSVDKV